MARTLRVSYRTILRRRRALGMTVGAQFCRVSAVELDEIVSNILWRTPDAGEVQIQRYRIRQSIQRVDPVTVEHSEEQLQLSDAFITCRAPVRCGKYCMSAWTRGWGRGWGWGWGRSYQAVTLLF